MKEACAASDIGEEALSTTLFTAGVVLKTKETVNLETGVTQMSLLVKIPERWIPGRRRLLGRFSPLRSLFLSREKKLIHPLPFLQI